MSSSLASAVIEVTPIRSRLSLVAFSLPCEIEPCIQLTGGTFQRRGVLKGFFFPPLTMALSCACGE